VRKRGAQQVGKVSPTTEVAKSGGRRKPRICIQITSDLPTATSMAPWERELLLPVVMGLLDDVLGGHEHEVSSDDHDGDD
jgi:hypothetical protein